MRIRTLEMGVGLFLLAGLLALLLLSLRVSGLSVTDADTYKLYAYFDNIAGLTVRLPGAISSRGFATAERSLARRRPIR